MSESRHGISATTDVLIVRAADFEALQNDQTFLTLCCAIATEQIKWKKADPVTFNILVQYADAYDATNLGDTNVVTVTCQKKSTPSKNIMGFFGSKESSTNENPLPFTVTLTSHSKLKDEWPLSSDAYPVVSCAESHAMAQIREDNPNALLPSMMQVQSFDTGNVKRQMEIFNFWKCIHAPGRVYGKLCFDYIQPGSDVTREQLSTLPLKRGDCFIRAFYKNSKLCYELCVAQHWDDSPQALLKNIPIDFSNNTPIEMAGNMMPLLMKFHQLNFLNVVELSKKLENKQAFDRKGNIVKSVSPLDLYQDLLWMLSVLPSDAVKLNKQTLQDAVQEQLNFQLPELSLSQLEKLALVSPSSDSMAGIVAQAGQYFVVSENHSNDAYIYYFETNASGRVQLAAGKTIPFQKNNLQSTVAALQTLKAAFYEKVDVQPRLLPLDQAHIIQQNLERHCAPQMKKWAENLESFKNNLSDPTNYYQEEKIEEIKTAFQKGELEGELALKVGDCFLRESKTRTGNLVLYLVVEDEETKKPAFQKDPIRFHINQVDGILKTLSDKKLFNGTILLHVPNSVVKFPFNISELRQAQAFQEKQPVSFDNKLYGVLDPYGPGVAKEQQIPFDPLYAELKESDPVIPIYSSVQKKDKNNLPLVETEETGKEHKIVEAQSKQNVIPPDLYDELLPSTNDPQKNEAPPPLPPRNPANDKVPPPLPPPHNSGKGAAPPLPPRVPLKPVTITKK